MNKKLVLHMLGRLMLVEAGLMLPSLIIAWALKDGDEWPFLLSMLITVAVALPSEMRKRTISIPLRILVSDGAVVTKARTLQL